METIALANLIDGKLVAPASGTYLDVYEPATGKVHARCPDSDAREVEAAVAAAERAAPAWSALAVGERAKHLHRLADAVEARLDALAHDESRDSGKPVKLAASVDIPRAVANLRFFAEAITQWSGESHIDAHAINITLRQPLGEARKALQLEPGNVDAMLALASADKSEGRNAEASKGFQRVIALDPSNAIAHLDYASQLPPKQALAETLEAARLDPDNATAQNNLAVFYINLGEYQNALAPMLRLAKLAPHSASTAFGLAQNYALLHRDRDAIEAFDLVHPDTGLGKQLVAAGKLAYQSVLDPKLRPQALAAADALRQRSDLDPDSLYDLFIVYLVLDKKDVALDLLDRSCMPVPFSCNDFAVNPTYVPLRGDPRFKALEKKYNPDPQAPASVTSTP